MRMELLGCPFGKFLPSLQSTSRLFFALRGEINLRREKFDLTTVNSSYNASLELEGGIKHGRFWATHVNRKWSLFHFRIPWRYQICIAKFLYPCREYLPKHLCKWTAQEWKKSPLSAAGRGSLKTSFWLARDHAILKGKGKYGLATSTRTFLLKSVPKWSWFTHAHFFVLDKISSSLSSCRLRGVKGL